MHLRADELVDLAEGARADAAAPHLAECARCRADLAALRATLSAVAEVEVPEPSPLFWDHLSRRVHHAVAAERAPRRRAFGAWFRSARAFQVGVAAVASILLVVFASRPRPIDRPAGQAQLAADLLSDAPIENDPPLALVASLAATVNPDAVDAGLGGVGAADHAVTHMNGAELRELHRLLQQELTQ
jgi:hypothetical protein